MWIAMRSHRRRSSMPRPRSSHAKGVPTGAPERIPATAPHPTDQDVGGSREAPHAEAGLVPSPIHADLGAGRRPPQRDGPDRGGVPADRLAVPFPSWFLRRIFGRLRLGPNTPIGSHFFDPLLIADIAFPKGYAVRPWHKDLIGYIIVQTFFIVPYTKCSNSFPFTTYRNPGVIPSLPKFRAKFGRNHNRIFMGNVRHRVRSVSWTP